MKKNFVISGIVALAILAVLWFKPALSPKSGPDEVTEASKETVASVLLFADLWEAEGNDECAEIIRIARSAGELPGVSMREFDTRQPGEQAQHFKVLVSPTVIITGPDGIEQTRLEGESSDIVEQLRTAVNALGNSASEQSGGQPR